MINMIVTFMFMSKSKYLTTTITESYDVGAEKALNMYWWAQSVSENSSNFCWQIIFCRCRNKAVLQEWTHLFLKDGVSLFGSFHGFLCKTNKKKKTGHKLDSLNPPDCILSTMSAEQHANKMAVIAGKIGLSIKHLNQSSAHQLHLCASCWDVPSGCWDDRFAVDYEASKQLHLEFSQFCHLLITFCFLLSK